MDDQTCVGIISFIIKQRKREKTEKASYRIDWDCLIPTLTTLKLCQNLDLGGLHSVNEMQKKIALLYCLPARYLRRIIPYII